MKKFKDIAEFENLLKSELNNYAVPAPPSAWSAVSSGLSTTSGSVLAKFTNYFSSFSSSIKISLLVGGISLVAVPLYFALEDGSKSANLDKKGEIEIAAYNSEKEDAEKVLVSDDKQSQPVENKDAKNGEGQTKTNKIESNNPEATNRLSKNLINNQPSFIGNTETLLSNATPRQQNDDAPLGLALLVDNNKPCLGDVLTITNTRKEKGVWMENGKIIAQNVASLNYKCTTQGIANISFQGATQMANCLLKVQAIEATVLSKNTSKNNFTLSLDNKALEADWYINDKLIASNVKDVNYATEKVGKHKIKAVVTNGGCRAEFYGEIAVSPKSGIEFFDIITPNGDGKNDVYVVRIDNYDYFSIKIINRENKLVFESQNPDIQWDGTVQTTGANCPNGEYIARISYNLEGEEPMVKNLKITLIRD